MKRDIQRLKEFAEEFDRPMVVAFAVHKDGENFQMTTYGKTKRLCKLAAHFGEQIAEKIRLGIIHPPEIEPEFGDEPQSLEIRDNE